MIPRLQIIRGLPGSGKSTLALKRYPNLLRLETDFVYEVGGKYLFGADREKIARRWLKASVENATVCGMDFVCSSTYPEFAGQLGMVFGIALAAGYDIYIHSMPIERNFGSVHNVPADVFESMRRCMQTEEMIRETIKNKYGELPALVHFGLMEGQGDGKDE